MSSKPELDSLLHRGVAEIIREEELKELLKKKRPLRLKQGFDPSRADIHLGHVVGLRKLRQFQELGHQVILIVGDWTAQIGDPSGENVTRPMLSHEQVLANAQSYLNQFFTVVDKGKTEVKWQSDWFGKFSLKEVIHLTSHFTVARMLTREDFNRRLTSGRPIAITELLYPLLQAYDSVEIKADVEFGGVDQKFNCLVGRELQGMVGQRPQQVFLVPLLVGTDGKQKMSKSLDNYIGVAEPPQEMYGKIMSIPDFLIMDYFELLTDVPLQKLEGWRQAMQAQQVNPMELKKRLGQEIVSQFHGQAQALEAERGFERVFQRREIPEEIKEILYPVAGALDNYSASNIGIPPVAASSTQIMVTAGFARSISEAKRLLAQGAVEVDGKVVTEDKSIYQTPTITMKVGKRRFARIRFVPPGHAGGSHETA